MDFFLPTRDMDILNRALSPLDNLLSSLVFGIFFLILIIFLGTIYLITKTIDCIIFSIGLSTLIQKEGLKKSWLAFVPILNFYLLGKLIGNFSFMKRTIRKPEIVLVTLKLFSGLFGSLFTFFLISDVSIYLVIITILMSVLIDLIAFNHLFKNYVPKKAVKYSILSALIPIASGILILKIQKYPRINPTEPSIKITY